jgi:nicotinate-nucleotide adenylyltransferase
MGVYGGAFDPPHLAHLALAQAAVSQYALDELLILPTGMAWHKSRPLSAASHRIAMARLAFADMPQARVDARETLRSGATYTIDTLLELQAENPRAEFFLLMGQDQLANFGQWHRYEEILKIATLLVALRADSMRASGLKDSQNPVKIGFSMIQTPASPISATHIRTLASQQASQIATQPQTIDHLVKPEVARYIAEHRLYISP